MTRLGLERERTALHEAGHCVVSFALGQVVECVVVIGASGGTHGLLPGDREILRQSAAEWSRTLEDIAVSTLAGEAALEVFGDAEPGRGAEADRQKARRVVDGDRAVERLYARAVSLAGEHRDTIARFAETLRMNGGRLAGDQVVSDALLAASEGWPSPRFGPLRDQAIAAAHRSLFERALAAGPASAAVAWIKTARAARAQVDRASGRSAGNLIDRRAPARRV